MNLKKLIGKILGIYCPKCGGKMSPKGIWDEKSWCEKCVDEDIFYGESETEHYLPVIAERLRQFNESLDLLKTNTFPKRKSETIKAVGVSRSLIEYGGEMRSPGSVEKIRKYNRDRNKLPHRKILGSIRGKKWRNNNRSKTILYKQADYLKNQAKYLCRSKTRYALKTGKLIRGVCERCGDAKTEAHHEDYTKPYEVRWLCRKHHVETDGSRAPSSSSAPTTTSTVKGNIKYKVEGGEK